MAVHVPKGVHRHTPTDGDVLLLVFATCAVYSGWPFFRAAVSALDHGVLNMAVLVLRDVGYTFSVILTFFLGGVQFFEGAAMLMVFIQRDH